MSICTNSLHDYCFVFFSQGLADNTVIARVDKMVWDLDRPLEKDCTLELLKFDDDEAQAVSYQFSCITGTASAGGSTWLIRPGLEAKSERMSAWMENLPGCTSIRPSICGVSPKD